MIEPIYIEKSNLTPHVILDKTKEIFLFKGRSLPQNVSDFYEPIINWLTEYIADPNPTTVITIELEYFNSSSSKAILQLIKMLETLKNNRLDVKVIWCYQEYDDDTLESGQTFSNLVNVPFSFQTITTIN